MAALFAHLPIHPSLQRAAQLMQAKQLPLHLWQLAVSQHILTKHMRVDNTSKQAGVIQAL